MPLRAIALPPAPGASDTFAPDTYLRRNEHPLTVKLIEHTGGGGENVPVTFGLGCGEGDFAVGELCPMLRGQSLPAQIDVRATWPEDGSIRHAIVSLIVPTIAPSQTLEVTFAKQPTPRAPAFDPAVQLAEVAVRAEFESQHGRQTVSQIPAEAMARFARVLRGEEKLAEAASRLAGPVCYEFEHHDVPVTNGEADADLDVFYRLRVYSGRKAARVAYVVENARMPGEPYPEETTVADRDFARLRFLAGTTPDPKEVFSHGPATHWCGTRYRVLGWIGSEPPAVYAKQDLPYLIYSQFFPKLDFENPVEGAQIEQRLRRFRGYHLAAAPLGQILKCEPVYRHMPGTGGRPDIGAYATWHRLALASDSPRLHALALAADGNGLGSFPIHRREVTTSAPGAAFDAAIHPKYWDSIVRGGKAGVTYNRSETKCPHTPDYAHTPSAAYYSYLTTGDQFFEEELAFWAMYPSYLWPFKGLLPGTTRARAWQLRNVTDAAFLLPDGHLRRDYLVEYVDRNLEMLAGLLATQGHLFADVKRKCSGRKWYVCSNQASMWQYTWLLWSLDNTARKGWPAAAPIRDGAAELLLRVYDGKEEFTAPNGKVYRYDPTYAMPYQIAIDLLQVEFLDNGQERDTFLRNLTANTGEMYYYTMVYDQHKYWFGKKEDYNAWKQTLPKQVMRPEDWPFDEALARKSRSSLPHEYGNAECSAALARYDNPRAQHMYDFVRQTMEGKRDRIRGTEYTK